MATYHHAMRTQTVNIDQAKNQLAELIAWAAEGGEILIVDNGKALARLVPPGEPAAYRALPPTASEFSTDEDSLAWEADGWENVAGNATRSAGTPSEFRTSVGRS
jgi:prevent-host-death family protein